MSDCHQICELCVEKTAEEESGQPVQNFKGRVERDLGLLVQCRNQATIISAEQPTISMAKKDTKSSLKHKEYANFS